MNRVEHAARGAKAAADAAVPVDNAHAAAEAAAGLCLDLLFGKGETVMLKGFGLAGVVADRLARGTVEAVHIDQEIFLVELIELAQVAADRKALTFVDEAVERLGAFASGSNRVDRKLRAGVDVAADKNVLLLGLVGDGIGDRVTLLAGLELADVQAAPVDRLTDGGENGINLDGLKLAGADRGAAALLIRLTKFHDLDLKAADLAVVAENFNGRVEEAELHALFTGFGDFFLIGRHFVLAAAVNDIGLSAETDGRAADVHCDIAAADDRALLADLGLVAEVDFAQEVDAAVYAGEILAGDAELGALLSTDGDIEALVALVTELLDRDILADLGVHLEVNAHLFQDFDFALERAAVETIAGNAHDEHAAGSRVAVEDGDIGVAHAREVVSAAQSGRAGANDGDLLLIRNIDGTTVKLFGDIPLFALEVLLGDKLLDLVDGKSLIKRAAGASGLAAAVADIAADRGEGVVLLDELERIEIAAFLRELDVALDGDVGRAGSLAGSGTGFVAVLAVVSDIVGIPLVLAPFETGGQLLLGILDFAVLGAELLAELDSAGRADLYALAAGDAVVLVDVGAIGGSGEVGGVEILAGSESKADAKVTVAETEDLVGAVDVRDLVDIAIVLGTLADLQNFLACDVAAFSGLNQIIGEIAKTDAAVVLNLAGALAKQTARVAAGAVADREVAVIFVEPVGNMLDRGGFVFRWDRFFHGDDVHTNAVAAGRDQMCLAFERKEGHLVEAVSQLGIFFNLPENHVCHLGNAGDKQLDIPLLFMIGVLIVILDNAVIGGISQKFNNSVFRLAGKLCDLSGGLGLAQTHFEHDLRNLIAGTGSVKNDVFRVCFGQSFNAEFIRETVRDHFAEIKENLSCHSVFPPSNMFVPLFKKCTHF